jgi:hypothetical protein
MVQASVLQATNHPPSDKHDQVQSDERKSIDCLKGSIPCKRPCRLVDGIRYLIYSDEEQDQRLRFHWKNSSLPTCEHCGKEVRSLDIYWRLFGLCPACSRRSKSEDVRDLVIDGRWEKPGGRAQ